MQDSFDRNKWVEDGVMSRMRDALTKDSPNQHVRKLYPLRAKLRKPDAIYGYPAGHVFEFARPKERLSLFPIEVSTVKNGRCPMPNRIPPQVHHYSSEEAELILPEPEKGN